MKKPPYYTDKISFSCLLAVSLLAGRASAEPPSSQQLEDVVMTGTLSEHKAWDSSVHTETISFDPQNKQAQQTVGDVLSQQPGIELIPGFRGHAIRLQGLDSKYVLILIDGQRLSGRIGDAVDLDNLSIESIERIEIVKGSGSVLYGSDAIGGVVNIITRQSKSASSQLRLQLGSDQRTNVAAHIQMPHAKSTQGLSLQLNEQPAWFRAGQRASSLSGSRDAALHYQRTEALSEKFKLGLRLSTQYSELSGKDLSTAGALWDRSNTIVRHQASLSPSLQLQSGAQLKLLSQYQIYKDDYETRLNNRPSLRTKETSEEQIVQNTLIYSHLLGSSHLLTWGGEQLDEGLESDRLASAHASRWRRSIFVQDEWSLDEAASWQLVPGARFDSDSQFGEHHTAKLGVRHLLSPDTLLRFSYGQGYRAPSFKELYLRFENQSAGYTVEGAKELQPEQSEDLQAFVGYQMTPTLELDLELFQNRLRNKIESVQVAAAGNGLTEYTYQNLARARTQGLDLSLVSRQDSYSGRLSYQYLEALDLSRQSALPGRSRHQLSYALDSFHLSERWFLSHHLHWWGSQTYYRPDGSPEITQAIALADAGVQWKWLPQWDLSLHLSNLLNSWDERSLKVRERTYIAGINWNNPLEGRAEK